MPVLLLAQGDPRAKDMLRKAIQARYGLRPPALESLAIAFKGRARARLGPISTWVPVEAQGRFCFPSAMRWDFIAKAVGVQLNSGTEAYDGEVYRTRRGGKEPQIIDEAEAVRSMQDRLWAIAALFLTPLGEQFVKLEASGENSFIAHHTRIQGAVKLTLRDNMALSKVEVTCRNPDSNKSQNFIMQLADDLRSLGDLTLPAKISTFWDADPYFELEPESVEANPVIDEPVFKLMDA